MTFTDPVCSREIRCVSYQTFDIRNLTHLLREKHWVLLFTFSMEDPVDFHSRLFSEGIYSLPSVSSLCNSSVFVLFILLFTKGSSSSLVFGIPVCGG